MHPRRWSPPDEIPLEGAHTETLALSIDGLDIVGWSLTPPENLGPPRGTLLLLHGLGGARRVSDHVFALLNGWRVLSVDTRGHGMSGGWAAGFGWPERAEARALMELAAERWPDEACVAWGQSQGAAAFVYALHAARERGTPFDLDGLILESCYADIDTAYANRVGQALGSNGWQPLLMVTRAWVTWRAGLDNERMRPADMLPPEIPLLIGRGAEDPLVSEAEWERFLSAAPQAEALLVARFGHRPLGDSVSFLARVTKFLERAAGR